MKKLANFKDEFKALNSFTEENIVAAFGKIALNQRKCDKYSLAYKVRMMTNEPYFGLFIEHTSRAYLLQRFFDALNTNTIYKLVQSKYTESQLLEQLNKK